LKGKKSSLLRLSTTLRGSTPGEAFERSASPVYYRFPAAAVPFRPSRFSLTANRNARNPAKTLDSLDGTLGFTLNPQRILQAIPALAARMPPSSKILRKGSLWAAPVGLVFSGSLAGTLALDEEPPFPYPIPQGGYEFDSAKVAGEVTWSPSMFQFRTKTAYVIKPKKEGIWDLSFSAAIKTPGAGAYWKPGRISLKIASPDFPEKWDFTVSWRLNAGE
jgi:hypothetical protein